jgi:MFS family permease
VVIFRSLAYRPFTFVWTGQVFSRLGDFLYQIALAWWVLEKTGSAMAMAAILIFTSAPMIIFSLAGGVVVDRYPRLYVMLISDLLRFGIVLLVSVLAFSDQLAIWHMYALSLMLGLVDAFFNPAYTASVPELVPEADLPSANTLTSLSLQIGRIAGPPLGAAIIAVGGLSLAFALNALTFLLSAVLLLPVLTTGLPTNPSSNDASAEKSILSEIKEGIQTVIALPWLFISILIFAIINVSLVGPYDVALPFLVKDELNGDVQMLGLLYALFPVGYVLGSLWMGKKTQLRQRGRYIYGGAIVGGLMLAALGLPVGFGWLAIAALINGAAIEVCNLAWIHSLQQLVPREKLGRVASIDSLGAYVLVPVGISLAGFGTEALGASSVLLLGGGITVLACVLALCHPAIRRLD